MEKVNKLRVVKIAGVAVFNLICLFSIIYCIVMGVEKNQAVSGEDANVKVINEFEGTPKAKGTQVADVTPSVAGTAVAPSQPAQPVPAPAAAGGRGTPSDITSSVATTAFTPKAQLGSRVLVDDFAGDEIKNRLGCRSNVYVMAPSRVMISRRDEVINGNKVKALMIRYDKKNTGGPGGTGGWCGYYTTLKDEKTGKYLDGSDYKYITFWLKGDKGDENLKLGLADEHWDKVGDSLKSEDIGAYLEKGKITTQWQRAKVPISVFFLDYATLSAITVNFEADCFPEGAGAGIIYISDLMIEK